MQANSEHIIETFVHPGFIEEVCRKDMLLLPKCIDTIVTLLSDPNLQVERRVIQVKSVLIGFTIKRAKIKRSTLIDLI